MNWLDLIILLTLVAGVVRGFATGAVQQITGILGLILSFALSVQLMGEVGEVVAQSLAVSEDIAPVIGFVLVFIAVQIVFRAIVRIIESLLDALRLTTANRVAGGAFGAFQAALLLSLAFLLLGQLGVPDASSQREALLYEPVAAVLPDTWDYAADRLPQLKHLSEQFGERVESSLFETR